MTDTSELIAAARALLPYLKTSTDPDNRSIADVQRQFARSEAERLRQAADEVDAKEAAIWRFRWALDAIETHEG